MGRHGPRGLYEESAAANAPAALSVPILRSFPALAPAEIDACKDKAGIPPITWSVQDLRARIPPEVPKP